MCDRVQSTKFSFSFIFLAIYSCLTWPSLTSWSPVLFSGSVFIVWFQCNCFNGSVVVICTSPFECVYNNAQRLVLKKKNALCYFRLVVNALHCGIYLLLPKNASGRVAVNESGAED